MNVTINYEINTFYILLHSRFSFYKEIFILNILFRDFCILFYFVRHYRFPYTSQSRDRSFMFKVKVMVIQDNFTQTLQKLMIDLQQENFTQTYTSH
jgi:hypothetical protein